MKHQAASQRTWARHVPAASAVLGSAAFVAVVLSTTALSPILFARNAGSEDPSLGVVRRDLDDLRGQIAETARSVDRLLFLTSSRRVPNDGCEWDLELGALEARLAELRQRRLLQPRLLSSADGADDDARLVDVLFTLDWHRGVILDPYSDPRERARSFFTLCRMPETDLHFTREIADIWLRDMAAGPDAQSQRYLADVFGWVEPDERVTSVYLDLLRYSDDAYVRGAALNALRDKGDDELVSSLVQHARLSDPSHEVRLRAADYLRRKERSK
jgi:hypothetical protein